MPTMNNETPKEGLIVGVQKPIFWLGIVSFLTDISSEMIFSILSIFLTVILGASSVVLGLMEGIADFAASSLDYISGYFSDKTGKRKAFTIFGYGFSTLAKLILVINSSIYAVVTFRIVERLGKSIRGAPRDALISSITDKTKLGYSFGFHKAMDKTGAVLGPFVAYLLLTYLGQTAATFQLIFWIAIVPALAAVIVLAIFIKEKPVAKTSNVQRKFFSVYKQLGKEFKRYIKIAGIFSLGYFSLAFLLLKAYTAGFQLNDVTLLYGIFNLSFILISIPIGKLGDRIGREKIIILEYLIYILICIGFIFVNNQIGIIILFVLYGIFYAIDEGQTKAYIAAITPEEHRGSALGIYNFINGIIYLAASLIAGFLWSSVSPNAMFAFAACTTLTALILFYFHTKRTNA
jgi:MFS family permease